MKREEIIAKKYLEKLNSEIPEYEPDGNVPPDFALGNIGVEVRRLNQNYFRGNEIEGIEQKQYSMYKVLEEVLKSFDSKYDGKSYWVGIHYKRPMPNNKEFRRLLKKCLNDFLKNNPPTPFTQDLTDNIQIRIFNTSRTFPKLFMIGTSADFDSSGFVNAMFIENLNHCIAEKSDKISNYKNKYSSWWLVLVNELGINLNENEDILEIKSFVQSKGDFDKVIVLNSKDSELIFEL